LVFERLGEIALPGPLGEQPGFLADGLVVLPVDGGWARMSPEADATPSIVSAVEQPARSEWVTAQDGKHRYRTTQEGLVFAEHRSHVHKTWVKSWRIVAPNSIMAPPILLGPRLCYAGLDDRVTCVRASNGHRLWAVDLGDRLSRGLACWPACGGPTVDGEVLLVVPDDGASVIALDAYDGRRIATFELPANQRFASPALVAAHERIAIARKGYGDKEAALLLLRLTPPPPGAPPVPYNGASPVRTGHSGR
jgi:outer membrane protein assembly factor BamB